MKFMYAYIAPANYVINTHAHIASTNFITHVQIVSANIITYIYCII